MTKARIALILAIAAAALAAFVAPPARAEDEDHNRFGLSGSLVFGDATHKDIEQRIGAFQEDTNIPPQAYAVGILSAGFLGRNMAQAEVGWMFEADLMFLDEDHELEIRELYVMLWYRRLIPFVWSTRLLPGAGFGYAWPRVKVSRPGPSSADAEEELGEDTRVLDGSGVKYAAGIDWEIKLHDSGDGVFYLLLDYRYRFGPTIESQTRNDGAVFFPITPEFDFEGSYFGAGVSVRW